MKQLLKKGISAVVIMSLVLSCIKIDVNASNIIYNQEEPQEVGIIDGNLPSDESLVVPYGTSSLEEEVSDEAPMTLMATKIPAYYNSVEKNYITSVKDQGSTNNCWAYSAISVAETDRIVDGATNKSIDYDENHLVYFSYNTAVDPLGLAYGDYNVGNSSIGGNTGLAMMTFSNWVGPIKEGFNAGSVSGSNATSLAYKKQQAHLENAYVLAMPNMEGSYKSDMNAIKTLIMQHGSGAVSYYHNDYYSKFGEYYYCDDNYNANHAVTIVGWDDSVSASEFKNTPPGDGAWIIKGSYGTGYGDQGYYYISYYDKSLYYNSGEIYFFDFGSGSNYDNNYRYDGNGNYTTGVKYGTSEVCSANIFTADSFEHLKAVSFFTMKSTNIEYTISIYTNLTDANNPLSGKLALSQSGVAVNTGYHTIELDKSIALNSGAKYSVVVTLYKFGAEVVIPVDMTSSWGWMNFYSANNQGESFIGKNEGLLYDVTTSTNGLSKGYSARIRAFTNEAKCEWKKNSDGTYSYYVDGVMKKNVFVYGKDGDSEMRYVKADGKMMVNNYAFDGSYTYFMMANGAPMKNRLSYDPEGTGLIYFDEYGHMQFDAFVYCQDVGYTCYFASDGRAYFDKITFSGGKAYYLDGTGRMKQNTWFKFDNGVDIGYANGDGSLNNQGFGYDPWGRVVFYHWNGMVARGLITDGVWYYLMDETDGHLLGQFK